LTETPTLIAQASLPLQGVKTLTCQQRISYDLLHVRYKLGRLIQGVGRSVEGALLDHPRLPHHPLLGHQRHCYLNHTRSVEQHSSESGE